MSDHDDQYDLHEHEPMPEGEEEAPPLVKTMSIVRWCILGVLTIFALVMVLNSFGFTPWASADNSVVQYHCPMHPTYVSSQPGDCPICGMTLVPIKGEKKDTSTVMSDTSMAMGQPSGDSIKAKPGQYTCPMDPQVISDKPGKCPICGMPLELVPINTSSSVHDMKAMSDMGLAPVPGLVPVVIGPERLQLINLKTNFVQMKTLELNTKLVGYITPNESKIKNIHVRINGWVEKLFVNQTGQSVKAGQPLLSVYSQDLFQAQQDLITAVESLKRSSTDSTLTNVRKQLVESARERLKLLGLTKEEISAVEASSRPSANLTLSSPFSGIVLEKSAVEGQLVTPDQNLFTIADLRTVWVLADVYEKDLASIKTGQKASMHVTAYPSESFPGKIDFIYPEVSPDTRAMKVRLEFENPSMKLRPGMYADVTFESENDSIMAVPIEAVMDGGETKYVFVVHNQTKFEPRLITTGRSDDNWVEILSGLSMGEEVVTSANFLIDSESRLKAAVSGMGGGQVETSGEHKH